MSVLYVPLGRSFVCVLDSQYTHFQSVGGEYAHKVTAVTLFRYLNGYRYPFFRHFIPP